EEAAAQACEEAAARAREEAAAQSREEAAAQSREDAEETANGKEGSPSQGGFLSMLEGDTFGGRSQIHKISKDNTLIPPPPPASTSETGDLPGKPKARPRGKNSDVCVPDLTIHTARNYFSISYMREHPAATNKEVGNAWAKVEKVDRKQYEDAAKTAKIAHKKSPPT
ncbi:hypothetical protein EST38_g13433, partial [Candolleomyces aberdarensis]